MTYFNLRKHAPEPEPEETEEPAADVAEEPETQPSAKEPTGPVLTGLLGPGAWLATRFGTGTAWTVHGVAAWACFYYDGWIAAAVVLVFLLLALAFTPKEYLDRVTATIEHRSNPAQNADEHSEPEAEEPVGETPVDDDPGVVLDAVRKSMMGDRGVLLTTLRQHLRAADTRAVREVLAGAGIRVREGVRTAGGNGPGVHRDDLPPLSPPPTAPPVGGVVAGEHANTNANNTLRVESRAGMTIISDPADRHRTHTLKKP